MRYIFTLLILTLLTHTQISSAQGIASFSEVAIQLQPQYPKPGGTVQVSIQSYSQNLQGSNIGWYLDDILLKKGQGLTNLELAVPLLGEQIQLIIKVNDTTVASRIIAPTTIDILWEAQTHTPRYYLGRALPVDSSKVRAMAIPHLGKNAETKNLIYNWYRGSAFLPKRSGIGKNSITLASPGLYDDYNLSVEVTNSRGIVLGQNGVHISTVEPELIFYKTSPLLGIGLHNALTQDWAQQENIESAFTVLPYFFSVQSPQELQYKWRVSNAQSLQDTSPNSITVTRVGTGANISVSAQHKDVLLQSANASYRFPQAGNLFDSYTSGGAYQSPFGSADN